MRTPRLLAPQLVALGLALAVLAGFAVAPIEVPPESRVASFLEATARGDESAALSTWQLFNCCPTSELEIRRTDLTRELAELGVGRPHRILFTEWWTTCCMPSITDDPTHAGRARIFVSATDRSGREHELVFDVQAEERGPSLIGAGHDLGPWTLREVYKRGERSVLGGPTGPLTEEDAITYAQSATGIGIQRESGAVAPGTEFKVKMSTVGDLKRELGKDDFVVSSDPARRVWIVAASGPAARGMDITWGSAVVVMDVDDHAQLGVDFRPDASVPAYFELITDRRP